VILVEVGCLGGSFVIVFFVSAKSGFTSGAGASVFSITRFMENTVKICANGASE
jgi:hypothetical protein